MSDNPEAVLSDLIMRFRVDEASISDSLAKERQFATDRRLVQESQKAGMESLAAAEEAIRNEQLRSLANVEALTKRHYLERVKAAKDSADEMRRIEAELVRDLESIQARREAIMAPPQSAPDAVSAAPRGPTADSVLLGASRNPAFKGIDAISTVQREESLKTLDQIEEAVRAHYEERKKLAEGNAEALLKIEEQSRRDLERISSEREALEGSGAPASSGVDVNAITGMFGKEMKSVLSAVGLTMFTGLSLVGFVTEMSNALNRMRAMEAAAASISHGAGQFDPAYSRALAGGLRELTPETGRSFAELAKIAGSFANVLPPTNPNEPGAGGSTVAVDLTRQVVGLSATYATPEGSVAKVMKMFHQLEGIRLDETAAKFKEVADRALEAGRPVDEFMNDLIGLTEINKRFGGSMENGVNMISLFSHELAHGIVTIQDLSRIQFGLSKTDEGSRAFYVSQALERGLIGGDAAQMLNRVKDNPAALQRMAAGFIEDPNDPRGESIRRGVGLFAREESKQFIRPGDTPESNQQMMDWYVDQALAQMGVITPDMTQKTKRMAEATLLGTRHPSHGSITATGAPATLDQAVNDGVKMMRDSQSWQSEVKTRLEMIYEAILVSADKQINPSNYKKGMPGYESEVEVRAGQIREMMRTAGTDSIRTEQLRNTLTRYATSNLEQFEDIAMRLGIPLDQETEQQHQMHSGPGMQLLRNIDHGERAKAAIDRIIIEVRDATKSGTDVNVPPSTGSRPANVEKRVTGH